MATTAELTYYDAIWTFDKQYEHGVFLTGEPWVAVDAGGTVKITKITPNNNLNDPVMIERKSAAITALTQLISATPYRDSDGVLHEVNPDGMSSGSMILKRPSMFQGYATQVTPQNGDPFSNADDPNGQPINDSSGNPGYAFGDAMYYSSSLDLSLSGNLPVYLSAGQMLLTADGQPWVKQSPRDTYTSRVTTSTFRTVYVLTIIAAADIPRAHLYFRPAIWNSTARYENASPRTLKYTENDVNYSFLKNFNVPPVAGKPRPTQSYIEAGLPPLLWWEFSENFVLSQNGGASNNVNFDVAGSSGSVGFIRHPYPSLASGYGVGIAMKWANIISWLNTRHDANDTVNNAIKRKALLQTIQCSLDTLSFISAGYKISQSGGGHKGGRKLLGFIAGLALNKPELVAIAATKNVFAEGAHCFIVRQDSLKDNSFHDVDGQTTAIKDTKRYTNNELGMAEWGVNHAANQYDDSRLWFGGTAGDENASPYRDLWNGYVNRNVLVADFLDMHDIWNHDANFEYLDRCYTMGYVLADTWYRDISDSLSAFRNLPPGTVESYGTYSIPRFYKTRRIVTNKDTTVQSAANSGTITQIIKNRVGTVIDGPENISGVIWWKIAYKNGLTGWTRQADISVLRQKATVNTLVQRSGIFESGKQLTLTTDIPDANVVYTISYPITGTKFKDSSGQLVTSTQYRALNTEIHIASPNHGIPLNVPFRANISGLILKVQIPGLSESITPTANGSNTLTAIDTHTLMYKLNYISEVVGGTGIFVPYPADFNESSGAVERNTVSAKIGSQAYTLPAGETTFSTAIVRDGYDMSNIISATYKIDNSGKPVQPSQLKIRS